MQAAVMGTPDRDKGTNLLATVQEVLDGGQMTPELEMHINRLAGSRESFEYEPAEREALKRLLQFLRERDY